MDEIKFQQRANEFANRRATEFTNGEKLKKIFLEAEIYVAREIYRMACAETYDAAFRTGYAEGSAAAMRRESPELEPEPPRVA